MIHVATLCALAGLFPQQDPAPSTTIRHAEVLPADCLVAVSVTDLRNRSPEDRAMLRGPIASLMALPQVRAVTEPLLGAAAVEFRASSIDVGRWIESGSSFAMLPDGGFLAALNTNLPDGHEIPRSVDLVGADGGTTTIYVGRHDQLLVVASDIDHIASALDRIGTKAVGLAGSESFTRFSEQVFLTTATEPLVTVFAGSTDASGVTTPPVGYLLDRENGKVEEHLFIQLGEDRPAFVEQMIQGGETLPTMLARFAPADATAFVATRTNVQGVLTALGEGFGSIELPGAAGSMLGDAPEQIGAMTEQFGALLETFGTQHTFARSESGDTLCTVGLEDPEAARTALEALFGTADESGTHPRFTAEDTALALVGKRLWIASDSASLDRFLRDLRPETRHQELLAAMQGLTESTGAMIWARPDAGATIETGETPDAVSGLATQVLTDFVRDSGTIQAEIQLDARGFGMRFRTDTGLVPNALDVFATSLAEASLTQPAPPAGEPMGSPVDVRVESVWIEKLREAERNGARGEDLIPLLTAPSTLVASRAAWLLTEKPFPAAAPALTTLVNHESLEVRRNAVCALAALGAKAPAKAMQTALADDDGTVRAIAVRHLGSFGRSTDVTSILPLATRTPATGPDRAAAFLALGDLGAANEVVRATVLVTDPDSNEERAMTWALQQTSRKLGTEGEVAAMLDVLAHPAMPVRRYAIERLGQLADPSAADALERRLATEEDSLRPRVEAALTAVRGPEFQGAKPLMEDEKLLTMVGIGLGALLFLGLGFTVLRRRRPARSTAVEDEFEEDFDDEFADEFGEEAGDDYDDGFGEDTDDSYEDEFGEDVPEAFAEDSADFEDDVITEEPEVEADLESDDDRVDWDEEDAYDENEDSFRS